jgi:hypothetical protein
MLHGHIITIPHLAIQTAFGIGTLLRFHEGNLETTKQENWNLGKIQIL